MNHKTVNSASNSRITHTASTSTTAIHQRPAHTRRGVSGQKVVIGLSIAIAIGAAAMYWFVYHARQTHDWIGQQLVAVTNTFLVPQLSFSSLTYTAPGTVTLRNAKLTSPDGTEVIDVPQLLLTLAQTPRPGRPLQIEVIEITGGKLHLVRDLSTGNISASPSTTTQQSTDGEPQLTAQAVEVAEQDELRFLLKGFSPFLKSQAQAQQTAQEQDLTERTQDAYQSDAKLSDVFVLRRVVLSDCAIVYDPNDGTPSTILDGLSAEINISPDDVERAEDADQRGWYTIAIASGRPPISSTTINADINIDTLDFKLSSLDITLAVDPYTARSLPGSLQRLVNQHGLRATVHLHATAEGNMADPSTLKADSILTLNESAVTIGRYHIPIERLVATTQLIGLAARTTIDAGIAGGSVLASINLENESPESPESAYLEIDWAVSDVDLEQFFSGMEAGRAQTSSDAPAADAVPTPGAAPTDIPADSPDPQGLVRRVDPGEPEQQAQAQEQAEQASQPEEQPAQQPPAQQQAQGQQQQQPDDTSAEATATQVLETASMLSNFVGIASTTGQIRTSPTEPLEYIQGTGVLTLRDSQLVTVPIVSQLSSAMNAVLKSGNSHSLDASFDLTPQGVQVTESLLRTEALAARGTGLIGYDGSLDLRVNGGPLEKVQSLLGGIGDIFGAVTDNIMSYRVRGTLSEPTVTVHPLGFGAARNEP